MGKEKDFFQETQDMQQVQRMWRRLLKMPTIWELNILQCMLFSTENWNRPDDEVKALMKLLRNYLSDCIERKQTRTI